MAGQDETAALVERLRATHSAGGGASDRTSIYSEAADTIERQAAENATLRAQLAARDDVQVELMANVREAYRIMCSGNPPHSARETNARAKMRRALEVYDGKPSRPRSALRVLPPEPEPEPEPEPSAELDDVRSEAPSDFDLQTREMGNVRRWALEYLIGTGEDHATVLSVLYRKIGSVMDLAKPDPPAGQREGVGKLYAALQAHHDWQLQSGVWLVPSAETGGEPIEIDNAQEYAESDLCSLTMDALREPPPSGGDAAEVVRLRAALRKAVVHMEWDCPGDTPEPCGLYCELCKRHVEDTPQQEGHRDDCLCAEPALARRGDAEGA